MALQDNGHDYDVLTQAVKAVKGVPGLTCEVGLREGGGSKYMIDALMENQDHGRTHVAIDCYGSMPYTQSEQQQRTDGPYPNEMMSRTLSELYGYVHGKPMQVYFFPMEDTEFFNRFGDGVPVYSGAHKEVLNTYACTYLDGPHSLGSTMVETVFFAARGVPGSVIVYDDVSGYYDHTKIKAYLETIGWKELLVAPSKISYVKV
jgi:hypothetical protein